MADTPLLLLYGSSINSQVPLQEASYNDELLGIP
jgi:hypothetical protein